MFLNHTKSHITKLQYFSMFYYNIF